jgi:hypothetical protein
MSQILLINNKSPLRKAIKNKIPPILLHQLPKANNFLLIVYLNKLDPIEKYSLFMNLLLEKEETTLVLNLGKLKSAIKKVLNK